MPQTSINVLNSFNIKENDIKLISLKNNEFLKENQKIYKLNILFKKIEK